MTGERPTAAAEVAASGAPAITSIGVVKGRSGTQVTISGDADLRYEYFVLEGENLVIDLPGATSKVQPAEQPVNDEFIGLIRVAERTGERPGVRVVIDLKRTEGFTVRGESGRVVVTFAAQNQKPETATGESAAAPAPPATAVPQPATRTRVSEISATTIADTFRIVVQTDAQPQYRVLEGDDPRKVQIAIDNARLEPSARKAIDYSALGAVVSRVAVWSEPGEKNSVIVTIDLVRPAPFKVEPKSTGLIVNVTNVPALPAEAKRQIAAASQPSSQPVRPPTQLPAPDAQYRTVATPVESVGTLYLGNRITLDFIDADLLDIFRLIADVAGINIIIEDGIKGKRSVNIKDIPWDQALDLILKTNSPPLARVDETPGVIRVTTQKRIEEEASLQAQQEIKRLELEARQQEMARKSADASQQLALQEAAQQAEALRRQTELDAFTFNVSYGDTKKIAERLKTHASNTSECGYCIFEVDERSNRIQVRDLAENIDSMIDVFAALDEPTPAVMVEARIVEVLSDFTQNLGIQWGANYAADARHGNATPFAFPNSIGIGGTAQQGTEGLNPGTYLVNLPAAGQSSGVGLSFGHIANTLSLDIKLSALEKMGKTKILSNPKVLVIQNEEAKINVGSQLPIPKTDAEGNRTVEWKDVGILLQVKPQVTNDGSVFMKVQIEKSARGETVTTTEGEMFSIERRGADTKVLVGDGETTVIGGIFIQTAITGQSGVPWFESLPVVGWLFKARSKSDDRKELMIFLTPRIVKNETQRTVIAPERKRSLVPRYGPRNLSGDPVQPAAR